MPAKPNASASSTKSCPAAPASSAQSSSPRPSPRSPSPRCAPTSKPPAPGTADHSTTAYASKRNASTGRSSRPKLSRGCANSTNATTRTVARTPPRSRPASPARSKQLPSESSLPDGRAAFACRSPARGRYSATLSLTKGSAVSDNSRAYNSVWQLRSDAWCRLEEASDRLTKPTTNGELKEEYVTICRDLLATLTPAGTVLGLPGHAAVLPRAAAVHGGQLRQVRPRRRADQSRAHDRVV